MYMKKFLVLMLLIFGLVSCHEPNKPVAQTPQMKMDSINKIPKLKVVFVLVGKDIDYNKMAIDEITEQIEKDNYLQINSMSPEIFIKPQIIKVYKVEDITCPYLKTRFKDAHPGELVYEYNDKILVKLNDGVIKLYHNHVDIK